MPTPSTPETMELASQAACRIVLCMQETDPNRTNQVVDYFRDAPPYDPERTRMRFAEAIWTLYEHNIILPLEAIIAAGERPIGGTTPFYMLRVSTASKWAVCHTINWPVQDYHILVDAIDQLAADDCTVLPDLSQ